jgi:flagellar secretion chaperone FliS
MSIRQAYREAAARGANPVALVVRLYEQMIEDMRHVAIAIEQNDIQLRSNRIKHVLVVIAHLQSSLDFDRGGKVAQDLNQFYDALRQNVVWVQFHPSNRAVSQVITDLLAVREAWTEVERTEYPSSSTAAVTVSRSPQMFHPSAEVPDTDSARAQPDRAHLDRLNLDRPHLDWQG